MNQLQLNLLIFVDSTIINDINEPSSMELPFDIDNFGFGVTAFRPLVIPKLSQIGKPHIDRLMINIAND